MKMTPREQAIRRRLAAATFTPWGCGFRNGRRVVVGANCCCDICSDGAIGELTEGNMRFIASAPTDLAWLLDLVACYRTALERCAKGEFFAYEHDKLVNVAKQALEEAMG